MQEIREVRCKVCGKMLFRVNDIAKRNQLAVGGYIVVDDKFKTSKTIIEIKCPHRIKRDGKNETCGTINEIEI